MTTAEMTGQMRPYTQPGHYPVNIRITVPFLPKAIFVTLIIGPEKRGRERLIAVRKAHPLGTWGNMAAIIGSSAVLLVAGLFAAFVLATL